MERRIERITIASYFGVLLAAFLFLIYFAVFEKTDIYVKNAEVDLVKESPTLPDVYEDAEAPLGFHEEYHIKLLGDRNATGNLALAFYCVHSHVKVYFDDELVYSLRPTLGNRIIKTTGCQWVVVPVNASDFGKDARIVISPVYKATSGRHYDFIIGTELQIFRNRLFKDLPQMLLSFIAIILGLVFVIASYVATAMGKGTPSTAYVGLFALFMGLWKITDTRFVTLLVEDIPAFLSYFSIFMLMIGSLPLLYFVKSHIKGRMSSILTYAGAYAVFNALVCLILQITGLLDIRELIPFIHSAIAISIITITIAVVDEWRHEKDSPRARMTLICFFLCAIGGAVDVIVFYINANSSGVLFTLVAFLTYMIIGSIYSSRELEEKANKDAFTGLYNRSRCNEVLEEESDIRDTTGFAIFDINDLKVFNDTKGHEAGDELILSFAKILRKCVPTDQFLGRYGGDEFIVVYYGGDKRTMENLLMEVEESVNELNAEKEDFKISYSVGFVISDELESCTMLDLFREADDRMFKEKKAYHKRYER